MQPSQALLTELRNAARNLQTAEDLDEIVQRIGDAKVVMLGEASHGTQEFYAWRANLSRRLIAERDFSFIAVEGDWPDCYRLNKYVRGADAQDRAADQVVADYRRWPQWMWANTEMVYFVEWLHQFNSGVEQAKHVGFYGLDVYSLWDSLSDTVEYIRQHHPQALQQAQDAYKCFEPYREELEAYAYAAAWTPDNCRDEVVNMLTKLRQVKLGTAEDPEERFNAEQNAIVAANAEKYYRSIVGGQAASWNVRDEHMAETFDRLLKRHGPDAKAIVWAHNTHIGDARATDMARAGMINIGQLFRQQYGKQHVAAVGFSTYQGTVTAARQWDGKAQTMDVPAARQGSWDDILHQACPGDCYLIFDTIANKQLLQESYGQRAIGVVYDPARDHAHNYVPTVLGERYDIMLYFTNSSALAPLVRERADIEAPQTFPTGL
jgi:erythromycin esterase